MTDFKLPVASGATRHLRVTVKELNTGWLTVSTFVMVRRSKKNYIVEFAQFVTSRGLEKSDN